jgi:hypothetical protein
MTTLLPARPRLRRREMLSSFLVRTVAANRQSLFEAAPVLGFDCRAGADCIDLEPPLEFLQTLAGRTGHSLAQLELAVMHVPVPRAPLRRAVCDRATADLILRGRAIRCGRRREWTYGTVIQYCPYCLGAEIPYIRREWRLASRSCCITHRRQLLDRCAKCGAWLRPFQLPGIPSLASCWRCGCELSAQTSAPAASFVLRLERAIAATTDEYLLKRFRSALGYAICGLLTRQAIGVHLDLRVSVSPNDFPPDVRHDAIMFDRPRLAPFCAALETQMRGGRRK